MSEMALTADHLLVIGKGRLIADTSVDEFVRSSSRQSVHVRSPQAAELAARCREAGATVRAGSGSRVAAAPVAGLDAGTGPDVIEITGMDSAEVGRLAAAHGIVRTSLIAVPKRGRVLAAKSLVFAAVTFVVGEVTSFTAFFAGQALTSGHAPHAALGDPGVARAVGGSGAVPDRPGGAQRRRGDLAPAPGRRHRLHDGRPARPARDCPGVAGLVAEPGQRVLADPGRGPAH
jgi:hypothetical protein